MAYMHKTTFALYSELCHPNDCKNFFWVDDFIALPVQVLNQKGYITEFCCSGHPFASQCEPGIVPYETEGKRRQSYIAFSEGVVSVPKLPMGFYQEATIDRLVIRKDYAFKEIDAYRIFSVILASMEQLYTWALDLPTYENHLMSRRTGWRREQHGSNAQKNIQNIP